MVEFSSNQQHLFYIYKYFEAVEALIKNLTVENLDDRLAVFSETLQQIKGSNINYRSSLSEFYDTYIGQDFVLQDDLFYINIILLLLKQGYDAISGDKLLLISNSEGILFSVRRMIKSDYLKILSETHPPEALVYMRSTLYEFARVELCNMLYISRYEAVHDKFICTPVPLDHIQLYLQVVRSRVVTTAFLELDMHYTDERLDRVIEYICSSNKLYYVSMCQGGYGLTCCGYVYLNLHFSNTNIRIQNMLRLFTLLHETAHLIVIIDETAQIGGFKSSAPRSIAYKIHPTDNKQLKEEYALEAIIFKKPPGYVYMSSIHFLLSIKSWNLELSEFQDKFSNLQEEGRIRGSEWILLGSNTIEACVPGVKCGIIRYLNQDEQDSCKRRLTFDNI